MHCILIQEEKLNLWRFEIGTAMRELSRNYKIGDLCRFPRKIRMVHISEVADVYVNEIRDFVSEGQTVIGEGHFHRKRRKDKSEYEKSGGESSAAQG